MPHHLSSKSLYCSRLPGALLALSVLGAGSAGAVEYRLNCGGEAFTTTDGKVFAADQAWSAGDPVGYTAGWADYSGIPVGGTPDETLYFTQRVDWEYRFDGLSAGTYIVELHFSDFRMHGPGNRRFDIEVNGNEVISNIDVFAESGMNRYSLRYRTAVTIPPGAMTVRGAQDISGPIVSAIAIWDQPSDTVAPPAPTGFEVFNGLEQIQMTWDAVPEDDLDGYRLYRSLSLGGPYTLVAGPLHTRRFFDQTPVGQARYYYVTAEDVFGNESTPSDTLQGLGRNRAASTLPVYEIQITSQNWDILNDDPASDALVPATFVVDGVPHDVEVRYRGSSTRLYAKKSWKVKFPPPATFQGRDILNLNAEMPDMTLLREERAYRFLLDNDVMTPRANHVQLFVNGVDYGVYADIEDVDAEFVDRVGLPPGGSLYRAFDNLSVLPDTADYMAAYEKKTNEGTGYGDLIQFIELINNTPNSDVFDTLLTVFDFASFYPYYAANVVLANRDFGRDDYYLYHDLVGDRWYWLPWDYNETWGQWQNWVDELQTTSSAFPGTINRLISRVQFKPHFRRRHLENVLALMDDAFTVSTLGPQFDASHAAIADGGRLDWFKWRWEDNARFDAGPDELRTFVQDRYDYLAGTVPGAIPAAALVINELMADNRSTITDEFGELDDWVELYNPGPDSLNLLGYHLTDNYADQFKFALPDTVLPPGHFLVVWCDGDTLQGPLHAPFGLSSIGEEIGLFGPVAQGNPPVDTKEFGPAIPDVAFGRTTDAGYAWASLPTPTPGASNVAGGNYAPQITNTAHTPILPLPPDTVRVTADIWDDSAITLARLWVNTGTGYLSTPFADDGASGDGAAGDGTYGGAIDPQGTGTLVSYYLEAVDDSGAVMRDPFGAPSEVYQYLVDQDVPLVVVNEYLASNATTNPDNAGEYDDWIEIYNADDEPVAMGGRYLTDDLANTVKWMFPDTTLQPGGFLLVWCDEDGIQGPLHANFKLSAGGEEIGIFESIVNGNVPMDTRVFGPQTTDVSEGRLPDGADVWEFFFTPTPGESNQIIDVPGSALVPPRPYLSPLTPNPMVARATVAFGLTAEARTRLEVFDVSGRRVRLVLEERLPAGHHRMGWDGRDDRGVRVASGVYFFRLLAPSLSLTQKLVVTR